MASEKKMIAIVAITNNGKRIAEKIKRHLPDTKLYLPDRLGENIQGAVVFKETLKELCEGLFKEYQGIVFCMALGIVVRVIAPYLRDKLTDPAVVVVDECARFAISTLCGHEGGANNLAYLIAGIIGAEPVITTASQTNKKLIVGLGCRKEVKKEEIVEAIKSALQMKSLSLDKVREVATIELKKDNHEIVCACAEIGIPIRVISTHRIKDFSSKYRESELVKSKIGIGGVCEPCALIAGRNAKLILPKKVFGKVTIAIAEESCI